jgi:hypothetical protein
VADANVLIIACGALAKEIVELQRLNGWSHVRIQCLPAELHNRPEKIPDAVLDELGVERLPGAHCYEFYAGSSQFAVMADSEPGTFYLTDFLTRHFDRLVKEGLGLDRHPELMPSYFGNYRRLLYLSQASSEKLEAKARACADFLGLEYEHCHTGLNAVGHDMGERIIQWQS